MKLIWQSGICLGQMMDPPLAMNSFDPFFGYGVCSSIMGLVVPSVVRLIITIRSRFIRIAIRASQGPYPP